MLICRTRDQMEVASFQLIGNRIVAEVKHTHDSVSMHVTDAFFFDAMLPELPPGRYDVEIRFKGFVRIGNETKPGGAYPP